VTQAVHEFLMREDGTFFPAPFRHLDGLVFALFLQFLEGLVDQGPFHEAARNPRLSLRLMKATPKAASSGQRVDQVLLGPPKAVDLPNQNCVKPSTASV
jgi:hypothetical protein